MDEKTCSQRIVRFGAFEVDLRAGELRKHGLRIKLQEQPFQILAMLVEHPGELVTREELKEQLWPGHTFVDFDHGLNVAILRLREALADSADNPRFVETLPRRGYRFIAQVDGPSVVGGAGQTRLRTAPLPLPETRKASPHYTLMLVAGSVAAVAMLTYVLSRPLPPPRVVRYTQLTNNGREKGGPLLTDGARLYFAERAAPGWILASVPRAGGETVPLPTPFQFAALADICPRRSELLVLAGLAGEAEHALWILPLPPGSPRRLSFTIRDWEGAAWSPDGEKLAYWQGSELYLARSDGSESHKLVTAPGAIAGPICWSPEGRALRFAVLPPGSESPVKLWEVSADGSNLHPVLADWKDAVFGADAHWTPDGKYFVFAAGREGRTDIWAMRIRGRLFSTGTPRPVQLTAGPLLFTPFVPSPDGKQLFVIGAQQRGQLVRYDARVRELVPHLGGISAHWVGYARDGQWVAYLTIPEETLWVSKADGSERRQLTFAPLFGDGLALSPDGRQIALRARLPGGPWKVYLIPAQGGAPQPATSRDVDEGIPNWSPDGKKLVFGDVGKGLGIEPEKRFIHVCDLTTHQLSTLPGSRGLWTARWSPDGRYVAALTADTQKLRLFDFTTQKWRVLDETTVDNPTWSSDGKYIYFDTKGSNSGLFRVRISDRRLERLADLKGFTRFADWSGVTPDDSPLLARDVGSHEIYALDWEAP
jgi:Tol biopolymer transport system component/DNA-binding winged helix-turn-helix (wHTH) protein